MLTIRLKEMLYLDNGVNYESINRNAIRYCRMKSDRFYVLISTLFYLSWLDSLLGSNCCAVYNLSASCSSWNLFCYKFLFTQDEGIQLHIYIWSHKYTLKSERPQQFLSLSESLEYRSSYFYDIFNTYFCNLKKIRKAIFYDSTIFARYW